MSLTDRIRKLVRNLPPVPPSRGLSVTQAAEVIAAYQAENMMNAMIVYEEKFDAHLR